MDAGFNKVANAMMLEVRVGNELRTNVVFDKPSEGARWDAEDFRGPLVVYVSEGDRVEAGDVVGLVEIMKNFHEIRSEEAGVVERFLVDNEDLIEAGQDIIALGD